MTRRLPFLAALGLVLATLSTASRLPLFDPDEGYYPATAAESVDHGPWWDLAFNGEPRWEKPILAYALIEGAFSVFGRCAAAARLPSAIEGAALILLVGAMVSKLTERRAGAISAIVLASTLGVQIFARAAHPEIAVVLSMAVTELLLTMWLVMPRAERIRGLPLWMGLSMGYGLLAKGPIAVVVPLLGVACAAPFVIDLRQRWREAVRDAAVAGLVGLAVAAPWYVAMTWKHGAVFLRDAVWTQNVGRFAGQMAEHGQSAGVFVLATLAGLVPWIGFLPAAAWAVRRPKGDRREAVRFTIAITAASSLLFYSLSASKLASYSLALLPPLSVLVGLYLDDVLSARRKRTPASFIVTSAALATLAIGLIAIPLLHGTVLRTRDLIGGVPADQNSAGFWWLIAPVAFVLLAGAALVLVLSDRGRIAALCAVSMAAPLAALLAAGPLLDDAYPWQRFGKQIASAEGPAWVQMYRVPSLIFFAGRPVERLASDEALNAVLTNAETGWVVLGADWETRPNLASRLASGRATVVERSARLILVRLQGPR